MLFNSVDFLVFAALFFIGWPFFRRWNNVRWLYITSASFFFYGWWDWRFLFLLIGTGLIDYWAGLGMVRFPRHRRLLLISSLCGNLGSLALFKYSGFIAHNIDAGLALIGVNSHVQRLVPDFLLILPVGISFYTFQSMSYSIDVYRGQLQPTRNVFHFFSYISLFPQLVAGPIVRATDLLPSLLSYRKTTEEERWAGLRLVVYGFFKKVVIADNLAPIVNVAFAASAPSGSCLYWWVVISMFAFQIYCDFSGYSDIARGLAKWMGYEFRLNFDHPYISASMREFWTRWHISLSTWFRDYVYIPLGGGKSGRFRSHVNMWITMVASSLWHGAAWHFVAWGVLHAACLSGERLTRWPERLMRLPGGRFLSTFLILISVWVGWVFFRATSLPQACQIVGTLFSLKGSSLPCDAVLLVFLAIPIVREIYFMFHLDSSSVITWRLWRAASPVFMTILIVASIYFRGPGSAFIYFQF